MLGTASGKRLNKYVRDYVVFDLETTGIFVLTDEVIEISAVKVENGAVTDTFSSLVNPGRKIPHDASAVNGITDDMVKDAKEFDEVLAAFLDFVGDFVLVGHNIHTFDMKFIYRDCERYFGKIPGNDYIDTLQLARTYLPGLPHHKLTDLAEYYGISSAGAHRALNDCIMNQKIFECIAKEMDPQKIKQSGGRICAVCGSIMKKRNGKFGEFWGCGAYPNCRYTEKISK